VEELYLGVFAERIDGRGKRYRYIDVGVTPLISHSETGVWCCKFVVRENVLLL